MATEPNLRDYIGEDTIFLSLTGSRLYGLHTPKSDYDFTVVSSGPTLSTVETVGELDIRRVDYLSYMKSLNRRPGGAFLESLYSSRKILGPQAESYMPFLEGYIPPAGEVRSVANSMALAAVILEPAKRVRLGALFASFWAKWYWSGQQRYEPTLSQPEIDALNELTQRLLLLDSASRIELVEELFSLDLPDAKAAFALDI